MVGHVSANGCADSSRDGAEAASAYGEASLPGRRAPLAQLAAVHGPEEDRFWVPHRFWGLHRQREDSIRALPIPIDAASGFRPLVSKCYSDER